jgi:hypothetical protein
MSLAIGDGADFVNRSVEYGFQGCLRERHFFQIAARLGAFNLFKALGGWLLALNHVDSWPRAA